MESYHEVWLAQHPERSHEWLQERLNEGFHVHHIDGDHANDDPLNLVLIEGGDHLMIHNGKKRRLWRPHTPAAPRKPKPPKPHSMKELRKIVAEKFAKL